MGEKTVKNLQEAFAGESQARNKYTFFAKVARKEGLQEVADYFEHAAANEQKHAELILRLLKGIGDTAQNLQAAIDGETYEHETMYPTFLKEAEEEGEKDAASYFRHVINAEKGHAAHYQKLLDALKAGSLRSGNPETEWHCRVCGYNFRGEKPPTVCPLCDHPEEFYDKIS